MKLKFYSTMNHEPIMTNFAGNLRSDDKRLKCKALDLLVLVIGGLIFSRDELSISTTLVR